MPNTPNAPMHMEDSSRCERLRSRVARHRPLGGLVLAMVVTVLVLIWNRGDSRGVGSVRAVSRGGIANTSAPGVDVSLQASVAQPARRSTPPAASNRLATEKVARIERIEHDYEELRARVWGEHRAAGDLEATCAFAPASPIAVGTTLAGELAGFGRQLALLETERRADLAAVLTPRELEDFELRESVAGRRVQRLLGNTSATDEQRRAVFRLQRAFDEEFAMVCDASSKSLDIRDEARRLTQEKIRAVLGDSLFAAWLRGGAGENGQFATTVAQADEFGAQPP